MTKFRVSGFRFQAALASIGMLLVSVTAEAATYYVATAGDDGNPGTHSQPFRTVRRGVRNLQPGDTLYLRAGIYAESLNEYEVDVPSGTSWNAPVTIASFPGETATLRPTGGSEVLRLMGTQYVVFEQLVLDGANLNSEGNNVVKITYTGDPANAAHHIRLKDNELLNAPGQGILGCGIGSEILNNRIHDNGTSDFDHGIYCADIDTLIDGNDIYRNAGWGIHIYNDAGGTRNNIIRNNRLYDNARLGDRGSGIIIGGPGHLVYNNLVWNNNAGIDVMYGGASDIHVYNNTIYNNRGNGISVYNAPNTELKNNIIYQNGGQPIEDIEGNPGLISSHNITVDPRFVNPAAGDFRLQAGSPAVDAGMDLRSEGVSTDIEGTARPQGSGFDIGAYEFKSGGSLRGDLNGDGKRDLADVRLLIYMLLGQQVKTPEADLTGDGAVTLADVQALIRLLVGIP